MLRGQTPTLALGSTAFCRRAEFESALLAERIKAGMARARAQGKHVGGQRIQPQKEARIRRNLLAGAQPAQHD